ncbi:hypothetical protein ACSSS7_002805 [Eimeria intestinalis]
MAAHGTRGHNVCPSTVQAETTNAVEKEGKSSKGTRPLDDKALDAEGAEDDGHIDFPLEQWVDGLHLLTSAQDKENTAQLDSTHPQPTVLQCRNVVTAADGSDTDDEQPEVSDKAPQQNAATAVQSHRQRTILLEAAALAKSQQLQQAEGAPRSDGMRRTGFLSVAAADLSLPHLFEGIHEPQAFVGPP